MKVLLAKYWERVVILAGVVVAALLWIISLKDDKNDSLTAQIANADTAKKADALEAQVNENLADAKAKQGQINQDQKSLDQLQQQRAALPEQKPLSPDQVENFWKNN